MALIRDVASVCKSKNAGPFELTIDVVFDSAETFHRVQATGILSAALFARLYNVPEQHVLFTPYDAAFAFKATLPRLVPAGDFGDTDVYGCQQHAPLLDVDLPI
jgi:molybdopterin-guanine dinucleotide biosynthesis protein A